MGDDSGAPQLRLEDRRTNNEDGFYSTFQSTTQLATVFNGYDNPSDIVFSFASRSKNDGSGDVNSFMKISATGNVSLGSNISPNSGDRLLVSGNVAASFFEGDGSAITNEQLDSPQALDVTFNAQVTIEDSIVLTPL